MLTSIIAAMGRNHVIGDERGLPWKLPRDLRRFRELTWGKPIILGRRTLELIGSPLPGRENVVLTRNRSYQGPDFHVAHDVEAALLLASRLATQGQGEEIMVIGGGEVYRSLLPFASRVYLTVVDGDFPGTATFPFGNLLDEPWMPAYVEDFPADERNPYAHRFATLERGPAPSGGRSVPVSSLLTPLTASENPVHGHPFATHRGHG